MNKKSENEKKIVKHFIISFILFIVFVIGVGIGTHFTGKQYVKIFKEYKENQRRVHND